ncbi:MAG: hypothetical protein AAF358_00220 [Pseudomonadota bacterium]
MHGPTAEHSLPGYFHRALGRAANRQGQQPQEATLWYLTDLLTRFARSEAFFDPNSGRSGLKPLAMIYGEAANANSEAERHRLLQRLGDVALFVAGLFHQSLERRAIGREYLVSMGGSAYSYLADNAPRDISVFDELATRFVPFVNLLSDLIHANRAQFDAAEILKLYDLWQQTGNAQARQQLSSLGISLDGGQTAH